MSLIRRLRRPAKRTAGSKPIARRDHILILGWNDQVADMIEQLLASHDRLKRFLRARRARRLRLVVLAERATPALAAELRQRLARRYDARRITLRPGSPLRADHLQNVDYRRAAVIILAAHEFEATPAPDERTIKTLVSAAAGVDADAAAGLPLVVAELFNADLRQTARAAYPGAAEIIDMPRIIAHLLAASARQPGLARVYNELLAGAGGDQPNQLFVSDPGAGVGQRLIDLAPCYERAVLLGVACDGGFAPLYADPGRAATERDRLVFMARYLEDCAPARQPGPAPNAAAAIEPEAEEGRIARRVMVLGWNAKLASLLADIDACRGEDATIDVLSTLPAAERETRLARRGLVFEHAVINQIEADMTSYTELAARDLASYDTVILVAGDRLHSAEAADARLLAGYLVLRRALAAANARPALIVETLSSDNMRVLADAECLVSPVIRSNLLARIALDRELHWVVEALFGPRGAGLALRPVPRIPRGRSQPSFAELAARCGAAGDILLGVMRVAPDGRRAVLNPADKHGGLELGREDRLIVLESAGASSDGRSRCEPDNGAAGYSQRLRLK